MGSERTPGVADARTVGGRAWESAGCHLVLAGMKLEDDSAGAVIMQVPQGSLMQLPALVTYLDKGGNPLVREWGISQTTLEEVFLRLNRAINPTANIASLATRDADADAPGTETS